MLSMGLLDSLNPSAIAVTIIQLSSDKKPILKALAYILGIFVTYFSLGIVLFGLYSYFGNNLDFGFLTNLINNPPIWAYYLQLIFGIFLCIYSVFYFLPKTASKKINMQSKPSLLLSFGLGATITLIESATALPYFGAISTIYLANVGFLTSLILLFAYNIIFVLPPLILVSIYSFFPAKFDIFIFKVKTFFVKVFSLDSQIWNVFAWNWTNYRYCFL